ncbi:unnamed protein product [Peronospora effusa]|nr:unnamed protein product [Peronospora effusa]
MNTLKVKLLNQVYGLITSLPIATTDLEVLKALINLLHEAGMAAGNFTAETLFDFGFKTLKKTLVALHGHIKALVGEIPHKRVPRHVGTAAVPGLGSSAGSHDYSSPRSKYESVTSSMVSALVDTVDRMQLGPTGAALLETRIRETGKMDAAIPRAQPQVREDVTGARYKVKPGYLGTEIDQKVKPEAGSPGALQSYFKKEMAKFLEGQGPTRNASDRGQAMRGRGPLYPKLSHRADHPGSPRESPDVDMESAESSNGEYDPDDLTFPANSARATMATATVAKVKTAFIRDQAPENEKCLIFGGLLTGPAQNWYRQLGRTLIKIRISDADDLEEVLLAPQRANARHGKVLFGSSKFRQKASTPPPLTEGIPKINQEVLSKPSELHQEVKVSKSPAPVDPKGEGDLRRIYAAATKAHTGRARDVDGPRDHQDPNSDRGRCASEGPGQRPGPESPLMKRTHCGSKKNGDLDCWKRLVCERCGKKGHPAGRCLFVCRSSCMKLPEAAEKMLN